MIITSLVKVGYESKSWSMTGEDGKPMAGVAHSIYFENSDPKGAPHQVKIKPEHAEQESAFAAIRSGDTVTVEATLVKGTLNATSLLERKPASK